MAEPGLADVGFRGHTTVRRSHGPNDGRSQPPPDARGEADLAPTTEFRAFLAGDPIPTGAEGDVPDEPGSDGWLARLRALFQGRNDR